MKVFKVGAYDGDKFSHWASGNYYTFIAAFEYCSECIRKCSHQTGKTYKVMEVEE